MEKCGLRASGTIQSSAGRAWGPDGHGSVAAAAFAQDSIFKVDVRLVRLLVTAKDAAGGLVARLTGTTFGLRQRRATSGRCVRAPHRAASVCRATGGYQRLHRHPARNMSWIRYITFCRHCCAKATRTIRSRYIALTGRSRCTTTTRAGLRG